MRMLFKYALEYKWQFFARVITISLVALASICFDFIMGFIVDIFSNGEVEKFIPIIIVTVTLIIVMFLA